MANVITAILPILQTAANKVARENAGFVAAAYRNVDAARAGYNQTVNYPIVPAFAIESVSPTNVSSEGTSVTQAAGSITMDQLKKVSWHFTGEQTRALMNGDVGPYQDIVEQTLQQAMRTLVNAIETSLWTAAFKGGSRAFGSAGTAPFATAADFSDFAAVARVLDDNGCPATDRHLVLGSAALNNLRAKQSSLFKANEYGSAEFLRTGSLGDVMGFNIHHSNAITTFTAGTNSGGRTGAAGYAVGAVDMVMDDNGTGTILQGDIVTITGDGSSAKYVIHTGDTNVATGAGTISIGSPGLRGTLSAATHALTTTATYTPNIALQRNGLHLVMRQPDDGMDAAAETTMIRDDFSGLVFQFARYGQYMQSSFELRCLYGVKAVKSDFIATLIG